MRPAVERQSCEEVLSPQATRVQESTFTSCKISEAVGFKSIVLNAYRAYLKLSVNTILTPVSMTQMRADVASLKYFLIFSLAVGAEEETDGAV